MKISSLPSKASIQNGGKTVKSEMGFTSESLRNMLATSILGVMLTVSLFLIIKSGDHLGKLESFPVDTYFSSSQTIEGKRFQSELIVLELLPWSEGFGRHIIANVIPDGRPVAIHLPTKFDSSTLEKGHRINTEIYVGENGALRIDYFRGL